MTTSRAHGAAPEPTSEAEAKIASLAKIVVIPHVPGRVLLWISTFALYFCLAIPLAVIVMLEAIGAITEFLIRASIEPFRPRYAVVHAASYSAPVVCRPTATQSPTISTPQSPIIQSPTITISQSLSPVLLSAVQPEAGKYQQVDGILVQCSVQSSSVSSSSASSSSVSCSMSSQSGDYFDYYDESAAEGKRVRAMALEYDKKNPGATGVRMFKGIEYRSFPERHVAIILDSLGETWEANTPIEMYGRMLVPDFMLTKYRDVFIEYDGEQHFVAVKKFGGASALQIQRDNDALKDKWMAENDMYLLRIHCKQKSVVSMYRLVARFLNVVREHGAVPGVYGSKKLYSRSHYHDIGL